MKLAMRIGGEYRLRAVGRRNWARLADEIGAEAGDLIELVRDVVAQAPDVLAGVRGLVAAEGVEHPVLARMQDRVAAQARACLARLDEGSGSA